MHKTVSLPLSSLAPALNSLRRIPSQHCFFEARSLNYETGLGGERGFCSWILSCDWSFRSKRGRMSPIYTYNPHCQWHHAPQGNTLLRIQTTPVERISHARTAHDQATADSFSLLVHLPEWVQGQLLLTPPPMSSKLVSKFAIPSANSKYPDHRQFLRVTDLCYVKSVSWPFPLIEVLESAFVQVGSSVFDTSLHRDTSKDATLGLRESI